MALKRKICRWWYDHVQSVYYNLLMKWVFLPLGGEDRFRNRNRG
ncbi:MAG: hypothetical protein ABIJ56_04965 [Pseudomonadota bacterium]